MKKDSIIPIVVLTLICLFISAALAITNSFTEPVITTAATERAALARLEIIPDAAGFELLNCDGLPATVGEAYRATNGAGYIFMVTVDGYGGDIGIICGVTEDGRIITTRVLLHNETKGIGAKVAEQAFGDQFAGMSGEMQDVSAISGATISSKAYVMAIRDALTAFEIVRGAGG